MPDSRDRLVRDKISVMDLTSLADLQAFAVHKGFILGSTLAERRRKISSHGRDLFGVLQDNKENISTEVSRLSRYRRSPLPVWYPRTPLRDITHIVNALERQTSHQREAALQRRNEQAGTSSPALLLAATATPEPGNAQRLPATPITPADVGVSPNPAGHFEIFVEDANSPDNNPTMNDMNLSAGKIAPEKYLNTSDRIERVVSGNLLLRKEKPVKKMQRSTLMMMR